MGDLVLCFKQQEFAENLEIKKLKDVSVKDHLTH